MEKIKIQISGKVYKVEVAETDAQKEVGLQNKTSLEKDEGMLFLFNEDDVDFDGSVSFWMKDTEIPLDIIFIDEDLTVISVYEGTPLSEELITEENVSYVLEVNQGSGIKPGDELEFAPDRDLNKMLVLDSSGNSQMELVGGERIFSRKHTKTLIKFAKKASITQKDNDYKALGKRVFKFLQEQSENAPEYVQSKTNN